jgi:hypothetical protein
MIKKKRSSSSVVVGSGIDLVRENRVGVRGCVRLRSGEKVSAALVDVFNNCFAEIIARLRENEC